MARNDNYPDDIRRYDHDPRSPFYDDSRERAVESALEDAAKECPTLFAQCERLGLAVTAEIEVDCDEDGPCSWSSYQVAGYGVDKEDFADVAASLAKLDREHPELADQVGDVMP